MSIISRSSRKMNPLGWFIGHAFPDLKTIHLLTPHGHAHFWSKAPVCGRTGLSFLSLNKIVFLTADSVTVGETGESLGETHLHTQVTDKLSNMFDLTGSQIEQELNSELLERLQASEPLCCASRLEPLGHEDLSI